MEDVEEAKQQDFLPDLKRIHTAAERFLACINDIVNFSKIERGEVDADLEAADTASMVQDAVNTIRPLEVNGAADTADTGLLLVVDDNEMNRDLLSRHLERQGHTVVMAEHGLQALEMLATHAFDLALLDIMMPKMNGFQVLQRIKNHNAWCDIPVIMISALDEMDSVVYRNGRRRFPAETI